MQTVQFLNKEWIFRDFLKFFPKIPKELQLLGKVEVTQDAHEISLATGLHCWRNWNCRE